jgi:hypothetical protein
MRRTLHHTLASQILLIKDKNVKISAQILNSDAMATTATTAATVTSVNGSDGGVKSIQIKNFFKKGDMKEVAVTLCDELFKEVQSVKGK